MNKSNFQLLAEELEKEISTLTKEVRVKQQLLESAPAPGFGGKTDYSTSYDVLQPNVGDIAGFGVGPSANPSAIVMNPAVLAAIKGKITPDVDPRVVKYRPYYSNNLATMMGLGLDMNTFNRAKEFINMYSNDGEYETVASTDDPEQKAAIDWKKLNNAVSNFNSQKVKNTLSQNHIFRGAVTSNYEQGVNDNYQRFDLTKRARKVANETAQEILTGKISKSRGKEVSAYIRQLSQGQKDRMANSWNQNPDQSGKIKFGK